MRWSDLGWAESRMIGGRENKGKHSRVRQQCRAEWTEERRTWNVKCENWWGFEGAEDINESLYIRSLYGEEKFLLLFPFFFASCFFVGVLEKSLLNFSLTLRKCIRSEECAALDLNIGWMKIVWKDRREVEGGEIKNGKLNRLDNNFNSSSVQLSSALCSSHEMLIF